MSHQESLVVEANRLTFRYNPAHYSADFIPGQRRLHQLSHHDLQQVLCSAIDALEQLEGSGFDDLTEAWRKGRAPVENPLDIARTLTSPRIWAASAEPGCDSEGISNTLPTVFNLTGWQWEEQGVVIPLHTLSKHDLMQAAAVTMECLDLIERRILRLQQIASDWRFGTLAPNENLT